MKVKPYFVWLGDCFILGPAVSLEFGEVRIGLCLVSFEVGLGFEWKKVYNYACTGCRAIGSAKLDELPPGWKKVYRPDKTHFFLCPKCQTPELEVVKDYVITDENREHAIDEIIGQLKGNDDSGPETKALRDYANRLLDESDNWGKSELAQSVVAYSEGFRDAQ